MGDFLHKNASTPYTEDFVAAGVRCRIATNFAPIFEAARQTFCPTIAPHSEPKFSMRFWVDPSARTGETWPQPHLRGRDHLVYAGFGSGSFALLDLRSHRIIGRFSQDIAADTRYWNRVIFPMMMSVIAATIGLAELHCACVAIGTRGLLLSGPTRSGKSTLTLALASLGFGFLSDDRTFCSLQHNELTAWVPLGVLKLRSEAVDWFPELRELHGNDGGSLSLAPEALPFLRRHRHCQPRGLIFLEPRPSAGFRLVRIPQTEAEERLRWDLMAESPDAAQQQLAIVAKLTEIPSAILEYSDDPRTVAKNLAACFDDLQFASAQLSRPILGACTNPTRGKTIQRANGLDPLRRFTPMTHSTTLSVMGKTVSFETNSVKILRHVQQLFSIYPDVIDHCPQFQWNIVSQPQEKPPSPSFRRFAFSDPGLRFAQFGEHNLFAVDLVSRRGVAFVTEQMVNDKLCFTAPFLDTFFCTCAASLGFLPLFSNCVAMNGKGLLILGSPGSGKTTASYVAAKTGMRLHADEGVFLEAHDEGIRAWGGFWPIMFRADALQFFPELRNNAQPFSYHEFAFYHLDKQTLQPRESPPITPVGCVFLNREAKSSVSVLEIDPEDFYRRLTNSLLFDEEERFRPQQAAILQQVAKLPAYQVTYGPDPAVAAAAIQELLAHHTR